MLGVVRLPRDLFVSDIHSVLRQVAEPVVSFDASLARLVDELWETLDELGDGGGLAAPQVGVRLRLLVVDVPSIRACVVNPTVTWASAETDVDWESCYSLVGYRGRLPRPRAVRLTAADELGDPHEWSLDGLAARVLLHEIDHLDGILYSDRVVEPLRPVEEVAP